MGWGGVVYKKKKNTPAPPNPAPLSSLFKFHAGCLQILLLQAFARQLTQLIIFSSCPNCQTPTFLSCSFQGIYSANEGKQSMSYTTSFSLSKLMSVIEHKPSDMIKVLSSISVLCLHAFPFYHIPVIAMPLCFSMQVLFLIEFICRRCCFLNL